MLLLCNYLLVVAAGLVNRPEQSRYSASNPYVHSSDCQQRNYLRLDCFDTCNGDQSHLLRHDHHHETPQHLLSTLKALDLHCLAETMALPAPALVVSASRVATTHLVAAPTGFQGEVYSPPRRG
ncbi:hypothetical protein [Hymenobacter elongatus]|uniref:Uncharacterized protein n=1 Tax=Hymenobacter elongatus TaxID=877208 RepID=A0A4Z0PJ30_9BACT|nr:hypothetical protein [Hymenobacter elongatus]TGE15198.1 hypothetical protein E5J99_13405 [Hymenobacter elongatus]